MNGRLIIRQLFIFGSVTLLVGLIVMPAVNSVSIQLVKPCITLKENNEQFSKVWVDDDWEKYSYCDEIMVEGQLRHFGKELFSEIQDGIGHVKDGGEVRVYNGTYYEYITVNKCIEIRGNSTRYQEPPTIIDGRKNPKFSNVKIENHSVEINNFTIINSDAEGIWVNIEPFPAHIEPKPVIIEDCKIIQNNRGIVLYPYKNPSVLTEIIHNEILDSSSYGIELKGCSNNIIDNNNIQSNVNEGILVAKYGDIESSNNEILNNNIQFNGEEGIYLYRSDNNEIYNNNIEFNRNGIWVDSSERNSITYNNISLNRNTGIYMDITDSEGTTINDNNIYANYNLGFDYTCRDSISLENNFWGKITGPWVIWSVFYWFFFFGSGLIFVNKIKGEIIIYSYGSVECEPSTKFNPSP